MLEDSFTNIPATVAKCPECGDLLLADFCDTDCETGLALADSVTLQCMSEDFEDPETCHRHWQSEWQPVIDKIQGWLIKSNLAIGD